MFTCVSIIAKASYFTMKFLILPDKIFNPKKLKNIGTNQIHFRYQRHDWRRRRR